MKKKFPNKNVFQLRSSKMFYCCLLFFLLRDDFRFPIPIHSPPISVCIVFKKKGNCAQFIKLVDDLCQFRLPICCMMNNRIRFVFQSLVSMIIDYVIHSC